MVTTPSGKNVRPAKGGFRPKARFGLKKEPVNGENGNGHHHTNGESNGTKSVDQEDIMSASKPKVMIPYNTKPGEVPRQVQIERKKRLFALQDISTLLDEKKVDLSDFKLKEQEIRNIMWIAECIAQVQRTRIHDGVVLTYR